MLPHSPELELTEVHRATFPVLHYAFMPRLELIFGRDEVLINRKHSAHGTTIPEYVTCYVHNPMSVNFDEESSTLLTNSLILPVTTADTVTAERVRMSDDGRLLFVREGALLRLEFTGPVSYPEPVSVFVSDDPARIEREMALPFGLNYAMLNSGVAARLEADDLILCHRDRPEKCKVTKDSGLRGKRLYTNGENVLILDENSLVAVKTKKG